MNWLVRTACWLATGDNAFGVAIMIFVPPLMAITAIGFF
jgi:formate/nitrite transporter FocA (FNT family)